MAKNKESKTLHESLEGKIDPQVHENLKNLQSLGIDPELFAQFEQRIINIIWENPWSEEVVVSELQKTGLSVEALFSRYDRKFRSILDQAANDEEYWMAA